MKKNIFNLAILLIYSFNVSSSDVSNFNPKVARKEKIRRDMDKDKYKKPEQKKDVMDALKKKVVVNSPSNKKPKG